MPEEVANDGGRLSILYVDDESTIRSVFKQFMEAVYPIDVETADSVDGAVRLLSTRQFDAVVSDYQMPGKSGIDFLKWLRDSGNGIPFILFTGKGREEIVIEALNNGADYYVQKGGEPNALFAELTHYIRLAVGRREKENELRDVSSRLESFMENTSDAILLFDMDGKIRAVNPAFETLYGWTSAEAVGRRLPMVPEAELERVDSMFNEVARTGRPIHYSGRRLKKGGSEFEASMTISAVKGPDGKTVGIAGLARDITKEQNEFELVARQREELDVLIESIADAVIATDVSGRVLYMNSIASGLTGYGKEEAAGRNIDDIFHIRNEDSGEAVEVPVDTVIKSGLVRGISNHTVLVSKDGSEKLIEDSASPLTDSAGNIRGVVLVFRDATARKLTERRREARRVVSEILATSESMDDAMPRVLRALVASLKLDLAELWMPQKDDDMLHLRTSWHRGSTELERYATMAHEFKFARGMGLPGAVWQQMGPKWIPDLSDDESFIRRELVEKAGLRSAFGIPLTSKEELIGVMLLYSRTELQPDENMMNTITDIGKQAGLFAARITAEAQLRLLLQNMQSFVKNTPLMVLSTDLEGNIVSVNDAFEDTYGWKSEEIVGKNMKILVPEGEFDALKKRFEEVVKGIPTSYEATRITKQGRLIQIRVTLSPIKDSEGRTTHLISVCREVTAERRNEQEIKLNHTVIENLQEMVLVAETDRKGEPVVVYANPSFLRNKNLSADDVQGKRLWEVDGASVSPEAMNGMYSAFASGTSYRGEIVVKSDGGSPRYNETSLFPLSTGKGGITHWVQLQRDITDLVEQRENLKKVNEKLSLMETISRHDMLNHLQAIEIYAQIALRSSMEEHMAATVDKIKRIADQMRMQLSALKDLQYSGNPAWLNVRETFIQSIRGVDLGGIDVDVEGSDAEIMADPLLDRVFYNLVDNSIRHGGEVHRITLRVNDLGHAALVTYTDDGVGVPAPAKKFIFSETAERPNHGLRLVRDILGITGISISETGEEGRGARFELLVPRLNYRKHADRENSAIDSHV